MTIDSTPESVEALAKRLEKADDGMRELYRQHGRTFQEGMNLDAAATLRALSARLAEVEAAIDQHERDAGISSDGNMWRFWSDKANLHVRKAAEERARADAAEAALKRIATPLAFYIPRAVDPEAFARMVYAEAILNGETAEDAEKEAESKTRERYAPPMNDEAPSEPNRRGPKPGAGREER